MNTIIINSYSNREEYNVFINNLIKWIGLACLVKPIKDFTTYKEFELNFKTKEESLKFSMKTRTESQMAPVDCSVDPKWELQVFSYDDYTLNYNSEFTNIIATSTGFTDNQQKKLLDIIKIKNSELLESEIKNNKIKSIETINSAFKF